MTASANAFPSLGFTSDPSLISLGGLTREQFEAELSERYGPKPINIFKRLRISVDLSHRDLAAKMYTTKLSLIRLEQGCYEKPLTNALEWWLAYSEKHDLGLSEGALVHQYEDFQDQMRRRNRHFFGPYEAPSVEPGSIHPLSQLRLRTYGGLGCSITEVSKGLCLNQATLQHFETKWASQKSVPKAFQVALMTIGYTKYEVMAFNASYVEWRLNNK